jgi:hypothetical protein
MVLWHDPGFADEVASGSLSTELGEVKMYLNACEVIKTIANYGK